MRTLGLAAALVVVACTPNSNPSGQGEFGDGDAPPDEQTAKRGGSPDDRDCVPMERYDESNSPGPSIARWKDLDIDVLARALPAKIGDMKRGKGSKVQRGWAGHIAPNVFFQYQDGEGNTDAVRITDTQHQCHCREGMGERLAESKQGGPRPHPIDFAGNPGMTNTADGGASDVFVWVADRCSVTVSSGAVERAKAIAAKLDWQILRAECGKRDPI